jgi:hypothetical protein
MSRPGGNITGSSFFIADLGPKTLGLPHELPESNDGCSAREP